MRTVDHAVFAFNFSRLAFDIKGTVNKLCFFAGNLMPDYSYHTYCRSIGHGFRTARKKLALAWQSRHYGGESAAFYFRLGVAAHYICDSFTYPHNACFKGDLKQHLGYETVMHERFDGVKDHLCEQAPVFSAPESCMRYLESLHRRYISQPEKSPENDLRWIAKACKTAVLTSVSIPAAYRIDIRKILTAD